VDPSPSPGWSWRPYLALALALLAGQASLLFAARRWPHLPFVSDCIQALCAVLALVATLQAASRASGFIKSFWRLQACGFSIWIVAQCIATVYDTILHRSVYGPWPSDTLFFVWMTPSILCLFLQSTSESPSRIWQQWLDFAQVGILVVSAYAFTFEIPSHWQRPSIPIAELSLIVEWSRDTLLLTIFAVRAFGAQSKEMRGLFGRMALFFLIYAAVECPYLYFQYVDQLRAGTWWDVPWSSTMAAAAVLISSYPYATLPTQPEGVRLAESPWRRFRVLLRLVPLAFPLVILAMAARIAEQQFALASIAVIASFACSSAQIVLTERQERRASRGLEERNALLKSVFEGSGDFIFVKDTEGRYLMVNHAVAEFFSKPVDEIIGKNAFQLMDSSNARKVMEGDRAVLEAGRSLTTDIKISGDGRERTYLITRSPYRDAEGKTIGLIGISRDITEHRAMEERLRQSQKMEAIGTLAGGVAHDFNNILMVISGYGSVLNDALSAEPKMRAHVEQIQKAAERAASLTRQLLAFSRKQTIQPAPLNLNNIVTGIEKLLHRLIGEHISISTVLAPDLGTVMADAGQIEQVILNLAINARDAMPEGGRLTLETANVEFKDKEKTPPDLKAGRYVELVVTDTGVGMDMRVQARAFEPFFTTKAAGKGTGLGLSTVYGIVQQSNGHIGFTSQPGHGTTFRMYLPRIDSAKSADLVTDAAVGSLYGHETVLIVEDDASVCELVRAVLNSHGYTVLSARDPQEAEALCEERSSQIGLLLSDVILPKMSGAELSARLTTRNPNMKVLFMSGYIDDSLVRQGIQEREMAFLQKPFSPLSLAKKVREVLNGQRVR